MRLAVFDTLSLLRSLVEPQHRPSQLFERAQPLLYGEGGLLESLRGAMQGKDAHGYAPMAAVRRGGYDAMAAQQMWGLFNPSRPRELALEALDALERAGTLHWARAVLEDALSALPGRMPDLTLYLLPGDPMNRNLMLGNLGLSAFGQPGALVVTVWPSAENLERLEGALVAELARAAFVARRPFEAGTLAEYLSLEGRVLRFARDRVGEERAGPWVSEERAARWNDELRRIARVAGYPGYAQVVTNVFGAQVGGPGRVGAQPKPDFEELEYTREVLAGALCERSPGRIGAYLWGDEAAREAGQPTVGLSPLAGLAAALEQEVAHGEERWSCAYLPRSRAVS
ncbi:uncharacterized protein YjaZ [Deinobacterium chartae]|uniref:Uncharacterized protein YjaZ n=1 Tax=Deinobacterium chartae TaxID=521158 RepID=A0A841I2R9_9DEIO|nr:DUF2268 domain-containing putative Zn-dependent protease [Deinobacterium chartae]MBB6098215.1 uncharacterized protein YjaZ [Deinobacterium chartae]